MSQEKLCGFPACVCGKLILPSIFASLLCEMYSRPPVPQLLLCVSIVSLCESSALERSGFARAQILASFSHKNLDAMCATSFLPHIQFSDSHKQEED